MKKSLQFLLFMFCCGIVAHAVPAKPGWQTVKQSDGTTLTIRGVGNAFNSAILTRDGLTVARGVDGDFYYISSLTGLTGVRAHDAHDRSAGEVAFVNAQRDQFKMVDKQRRSRSTARLNAPHRGGSSNADAGVPAMGSRRVPIILVEFKDKKFNNTREQIIESMLSGNLSAGQYFRDQSNGMYQPEFEVFGIYCLSQNREYYGGHDGDDNDKQLGAMVTEAVQLAAADGVSFSPYDTNDDDMCDVVIVIYAGVGEAQAYWNHPEAVWPCHWNLSSAAYYNQGGNGAFRPSKGDPYVDSFAVFNELNGSDDNGTLIDGVGTFCHEYSHCLGLPDFYCTRSDADFYGMGSWSIMDYGCYNGGGFVPLGYSAYEKAFMGWIEYVTPLPGTYYTLPVWNQGNAETDKAVCIVSDINPNEYFIFENRKRQGWDTYMAGDGIMVTHVTFDADRWWGNSPNNESIQLMTILPADGNLSFADEDTDLWPQGANNALTDDTTPATTLNMTSNGSITGSAGKLHKPVTEMVINPDNTASFWFMKGSVTRPKIWTSVTDLNVGGVMMNNTGTKSFKVTGQALTGDVTVTLNDANGVFSVATPTLISSADAVLGVDVTVDFQPTAIQNYHATLTLSSDGAQDVIVNLDAYGTIERYTPVMKPVDSTYINLTQFRADWIDQTPVENLASYTLEVSTKPLAILKADADFSGVPDAIDDGYLDDISSNPSGYLPEGWSGGWFLGAYDQALILAYGGRIKTATYDFKGYDKATVVITAANYYGDPATLSVMTRKDYQEFSPGDDFHDYMLVLDCDVNDAVKIRVDDDGIARVNQVKVYAGDLTDTHEVVNPVYLLMTDITGRFCLVEDLPAEGTYIYRVKSLYGNGTESPWSNYEEVTLYENVHSYGRGDVNHDNIVDIDDVTLLISLVLGIDHTACPICANVDSQGSIDINDITALISVVLGGN